MHNRDGYLKTVSEERSAKFNVCVAMKDFDSANISEHKFNEYSKISFSTGAVILSKLNDAQCYCRTKIINFVLLTSQFLSENSLFNADMHAAQHTHPKHTYKVDQASKVVSTLWWYSSFVCAWTSLILLIVHVQL